jgi:hypothetical protein
MCRHYWIAQQHCSHYSDRDRTAPSDIELPDDIDDSISDHTFSIGNELCSLRDDAVRETNAVLDEFERIMGPIDSYNYNPPSDAFREECEPFAAVAQQVTLETDSVLLEFRRRFSTGRTQ